VEVLFRTYPVEEKLFFPAGNQVMLMPDLQHEEMPECFPPESLARRRAAFGLALREAGAIAVLAEHGRSVLLRHHPRNPEDVFLLSPALPLQGDGVRTGPLDPVEEALIPRQPFFLFPANLWPHKNHRRLLAALARFRQRHPDRPVELVLTGDPAGWPELQAEHATLPVRHLGFVSKRLLAELYRRAVALVYFSQYEGFGIPLLEAFSFGTPVLCSNTTSLPEIGGDAVLLCAPGDVDAMTDLMSRITEDDSLRPLLAERGARRLALYDWQRPARNLLDALVRVGQQPVDHVALLDRVAERLQADWTARLQVIVTQNEQLQQMQQALVRVHEEASKLHQHCLDVTARLEESQRKGARLRKLFTWTPSGLLYRLYRKLKTLVGRSSHAGRN
jgi:glycosyltransferase involved in cell wall biosynthesis